MQSLPNFVLPLISNQKLLKISKAWFITAFIGQILFAIYLLIHYLMNGVLGNLDKWSESSTGAIVEGDAIGNVSFLIHITLALVVTIGGPLQLIPIVRRRYPKFHRINGRIYVISGILISLVGFYLIWVRGTAGDTKAHIMTTINGILIIITAIMTMKKAISRNIDQHQKWAIRLFISMSGVYFFRVFLNFWLILSHGKGIDFESFTGPAIDAVNVASYILPLLVLEFCFRAYDAENKSLKLMSFGLVLSLIFVFLIGVFGAFTFMWWPFISKAG